MAPTRFPALLRHEHANSPPAGRTTGFGTTWRGWVNISGPRAAPSIALSDGTTSCWPPAISSDRAPGGSTPAGLGEFPGSSPWSPAPLKLPQVCGSIETTERRGNPSAAAWRARTCRPPRPCWLPCGQVGTLCSTGACALPPADCAWLPAWSHALVSGRQSQEASHRLSTSMTTY
jgi:hypothetical protein